MADIFQQVELWQEISQLRGNHLADISAINHNGRFGHFGGHYAMASYSGDGCDSSAHNLAKFAFAQRRLLVDDEPFARDFPLAIRRLNSLVKKKKKKINHSMCKRKWDVHRSITDIPKGRNDMFEWSRSSAPLKRLSSM